MLLTLRRAGAGRQRQPAALALYRAQLVELDRELSNGRVAAADHAAALLEVQRRLLAAARTVDPAVRPPGRREPMVLAMLMAVAMAFGLYTIHGRPNLPTHAPLLDPANNPADDPAGNDERARLQRMIDTLDVDAEATRRAQVERGDDAERRGDLAAAAATWRKALATRFDPVLAVRTADAESRLAGRIGFGAATLFRRALATVPLDTPWRPLVEQRLAEAEAPN